MEFNYNIKGIYNQLNYREDLKEVFFHENPTLKFKKISKERKEIIEKMATLSALYYTTLPLEEKFYQILIELNNNRDYALARGDEKLLFFLMCFDSNLTLLQIFQSSSDNTEYEKRVREEFGFFPTKRLLTLEKFYNERFPTIKNEPQQKL